MHRRVVVHHHAIGVGDEIEDNSVTPNIVPKPVKRVATRIQHHNRQFHIEERDVDCNAVGVDLRNNRGSDLWLVEVHVVRDEQRVAHLRDAFRLAVLFVH